MEGVLKMLSSDGVMLSLRYVTVLYPIYLVYGTTTKETLCGLIGNMDTPHLVVSRAKRPVKMVMEFVKGNVECIAR